MAGKRKKKKANASVKKPKSKSVPSVKVKKPKRRPGRPKSKSVLTGEGYTQIAESVSLQLRFLAHYAKTGLFYKTCEKYNVCPNTVYALRDRDDNFKRALEKAKAIFSESIEDEVYRRGIRGVLRGVYYQGQRVAQERQYSDRLLELAVKTHNPAFRDKVEVNANVKAGVLVLQGNTKDAAKWIAAFNQGGNNGSNGTNGTQQRNTGGGGSG